MAPKATIGIKGLMGTGNRKIIDMILCLIHS